MYPNLEDEDTDEEAEPITSTYMPWPAIYLTYRDHKGRRILEASTDDNFDRYSRRWATRLAKVKSMHRVDAFGNSLGVCWKLTKGIGSLPGWRKGVRQKKTETRRKIVGDSRKAYRESG
ncbi:hypothetical protein BHM03_00049051 [Ensete ventricosum]|nr:hypothetical protein BHM03_00049051 [Ensete ventricosum]